MKTIRFKSPAAVLVLLTALISAPVLAGRTTITFTEDFEDGINEGGWTIGGGFSQVIEPTGGNSGSYLHDDFLDAFAAQPRTSAGLRTIFHGNYRSRSVKSVGIDLALFAVDFTSKGRPLSVILTNDGGTAGDPIDDCQVFRVGGHPTPMPNGNWQSYRFRVPSGSTTLPQGWKARGCPGLTEDEAWNRVITDVDELRFFTGDPELFFVFQVWDIGLDNPTITLKIAPPSLP